MDYYGKVQEAGSWLRPWFNIFDSNENLQFKVQGPFCNMSFGCCCCPRWCREVRYHILDPNTEEEVGVFFKYFSGLVQEFVTDADNFVIEFPESIDVKMKTVLLSAVLLVDIIYFNTQGGGNSVLGLFI